MRLTARFIPKTIASNIMPKAMAISMLPLAVSSSIPVVKTSVQPTMPPPTSMATPNSAIARLKLAIAARKTPFKASFKTAMEAWDSDAPKVLAKFIISLSTASMAVVAKLTTIGVTSMASPMIIAVGVYNRLKNPSGPPLEKTRYKIKPKATVGTPMKVLKTLFISSLPRKSFSPRSIAMGTPHSMAINVAAPETYNERKVASQTLGFPEKMSSNAFRMQSSISVKLHFPNHKVQGAHLHIVVGILPR